MPVTPVWSQFVGPAEQNYASFNRRKNPEILRCLKTLHKEGYGVDVAGLAYDYKDVNDLFKDRERMKECVDRNKKNYKGDKDA